MDFLKKNWIIIALIISGLILTWILFRGCAPSNTHAGEKKAVDSVAGFWAVKVKQAEKYFDSVNAVNQQYETAIRSLQTQVTQKQVLADARQRQLNDLAAKYKAEHDTAAKIKDCDSLVVIINEQSSQIGNYAHLTDSIVAQHNKEIENEINQVIALKSIVINQGIALQVTTQKYDGLYKDYSTSVKANKFNKTLSRVLAGVVLVIGGALILK